VRIVFLSNLPFSPADIFLLQGPEPSRTRQETDALYTTFVYCTLFMVLLFAVGVFRDLLRAAPVAQLDPNALPLPSSNGGRGTGRRFSAVVHVDSTNTTQEEIEKQEEIEAAMVQIKAKKDSVSYLPVRGDNHVLIQGMDVSVKGRPMSSQYSTHDPSQHRFKSKDHIYALLENTLPHIFGTESFMHRVLMELWRYHRWVGERVPSSKLHVVSLATKVISYFFVPALCLDLATTLYVENGCYARDTHKQCLDYTSRLTSDYDSSAKCFWDFEARECYFDWRHYYDDGFTIEEDLDDAVVLALFSLLMLCPALVWVDKVVVEVLNGHIFDDDVVGSSGSKDVAARYRLGVEEVDTGPPVYDEARSLNNQVRNYVTAVDDDNMPVHSDDMQRALRSLWCLDKRGQFALAGELDGKEDMLRRVEVCLHVVKDELEYNARFLLEKHKAVQGQRLLYLVQRDLLGVIPGQVMTNKFRRDMAYIEGNPLVPLSQWTFCATTLLTLNCSMVFYLFCFWTSALGYHQAVERQWNLVWTFVVLIVMDCVVVSTMEVLVVHVLVPCTVYARARDHFTRVLDAIHSFLDDAAAAHVIAGEAGRGGRNPEAVDGNDDDDDDYAPLFNASKLLFVSSRVARRLPEVVEAAVVSRFPRTAPTHSHLHFGTWFLALHEFFKLSIYLQDVMVQIAVAFVGMLLLYLHVEIFSLGPVVLLLPTIALVGLAYSMHRLVISEPAFMGQPLDVGEADLAQYGELPVAPPPPSPVVAAAAADDAADGAAMPLAERLLTSLNAAAETNTTVDIDGNTVGTVGGRGGGDTTSSSLWESERGLGSDTGSRDISDIGALLEREDALFENDAFDKLNDGYEDEIDKTLIDTISRPKPKKKTVRGGVYAFGYRLWW
jgi:hypothetical protein